MITAGERRQFAAAGFLHVPGLLRVAEDLEPLIASYTEYLDRLLGCFLSEKAPALGVDPGALPFTERLAVLLGCSGGRALHHLDPALNVLVDGYRRRQDLPSAQGPALFHLLRSERLLDAIECLIGSEISVSPIHHVHLKPARSQLRLAEKVAAEVGERALAEFPMWSFQVGRTAFHTDAAYCLPDAWTSRIVNAWIPLTSATIETACLRVVPGSHVLPTKRGAIPEAATGGAISVPAEPGDVLFLHNNVIHASYENCSESSLRWSLSLRYLPTGEATGRPFLPGFVARSRRAPERELRDADLWREMWRSALDHLAANPQPPDLARSIDRIEAEALTARWRALVPEPEDWLRLR